MRYFFFLTLAFAVNSPVSADEAPMQISLPTEAQQTVIDQIAAGIGAKIRTDFAKAGRAVRDAHAKHHGCVKATFTIAKDIEGTNLNHGIFANAGKPYSAWIRFSNGSGDPEGDDRVAGGRGMAVKLFGVEGDKYMLDEKYTQDFQMINYPAFFVNNIADYAMFETDPGKFVATHPDEAKVIGAITSRSINPPMNPLESRYFSMTPRHLGPTTKTNMIVRPIKFSAIPVPCERKELPAALPLADSKDALRIAMRETLKIRAACFDFQVQKQTNENDMPVDNPVKIWAERALPPETFSPFRTVAKIVIEPQSFESKAQEDFCEDLSITPWHSIAEHQPLGGIELARKKIYETTSIVRHELNQRPRTEPTGKETF